MTVTITYKSGSVATMDNVAQAYVNNKRLFIGVKINGGIAECVIPTDYIAKAELDGEEVFVNEG